MQFLFFVSFLIVSLNEIIVMVCVPVLSLYWPFVVTIVIIIIVGGSGGIVRSFFWLAGWLFAF